MTIIIAVIVGTVVLSVVCLCLLVFTINSLKNGKKLFIFLKNNLTYKIFYLYIYYTIY
jgi:hypothetical protein